MVHVPAIISPPGALDIYVAHMLRANGVHNLPNLKVVHMYPIEGSSTSGGTSTQEQITQDNVLLFSPRLAASYSETYSNVFSHSLSLITGWVEVTVWPPSKVIWLHHACKVGTIITVIFRIREIQC
jgi:hypothetical protein